MTTDGWIYALALYRDDGAELGQFAIDVDWEPACQWTRHLAICQGHRNGWHDAARVAPIWHSTGEPVLSGFRVLLNSNGSPAVACDFTTGFFAASARALSSSFVTAGALSEGETFRYMALAVRDPEGAPSASRLHLVVRDMEDAAPVQEAALAEAVAGAAPIGEPIPGEIPVVAAPRVLDEIVGLTHAAGAVETGGALVGHLFRDTPMREVFVCITAQVPARHTEATAMRLAFTPDTWRDLQRDTDARAMGERLVGWWHSHPVADWNAGSSGEGSADDETLALGDCFSEHDSALHRTVFPGAHCIALVANRLAADTVKFSIFGWHQAVLRRRGLFVAGVPA
jgi:hypothetical protein